MAAGWLDWLAESKGREPSSSLLRSCSCLSPGNQPSVSTLKRCKASTVRLHEREQQVRQDRVHPSVLAITTRTAIDPPTVDIDHACSLQAWHDGAEYAANHSAASSADHSTGQARVQRVYLDLGWDEWICFRLLSLSACPVYASLHAL